MDEPTEPMESRGRKGRAEQEPVLRGRSSAPKLTSLGRLCFSRLGTNHQGKMDTGVPNRTISNSSSMDEL